MVPSVFFVNGGRKLASENGKLLLVDFVATKNRDWLAIGVAEADFSLSSLPSDHEVDCGDHCCIRSYPGHSPIAMCIIVNKDFRHLLNDIQWNGRACKACFSSVGSGHRHLSGCNFNFDFVFCHGRHRELLVETCNEVAWFVQSSKSANRSCVVLGDFNADFLPIDTRDPWKDSPGRQLHHADERSLVMGVVEAFNGQIPQAFFVRVTARKV